MWTSKIVCNVLIIVVKAYLNVEFIEVTFITLKYVSQK